MSVRHSSWTLKPILTICVWVVASVLYTVNAAGTATPTTTVLGVTPTSPAAAGTVETLTATVAPTAPGSVQFLDGTNSLGAPVPVTGATAALTTTLASGTHSLTAVFTPTDPTAFGGSASPVVPYAVNAKRPLCIRLCR